MPKEKDPTGEKTKTKLKKDKPRKVIVKKTKDQPRTHVQFNDGRRIRQGHRATETRLGARRGGGGGGGR